MKSGAINAGLMETDNYEHDSRYVQHQNIGTIIVNVSVPSAQYVLIH